MWRLPRLLAPANAFTSMVGASWASKRRPPAPSLALVAQRAADVVVGPYTEVGRAPLRPAAAAVTPSKTTTQAAAAASHGPAPTFALRAPTASLIPLGPPPSVARAYRVVLVRAAMSLQLGPGRRPLLPCALMVAGLAPSSSDARASLRLLAYERPAACQARALKGSRALVAAALGVAGIRVGRPPPEAVRREA